MQPQPDMQADTKAQIMTTAGLVRNNVMKVYPGTGIKQFEGIQKKQPADSAQKTARPKEGDTVDFSKQLQQVQDKKDAFSGDSDRQARLKSVKDQIANGSYAPDPQKVASSLVQFIMKGNSNG